MLVGVLDDDAEAGGADGIFGCAKYPHSGMVHLDYCIDALARAKEEGFDRLGRGNWVAVERDDLELVARKCDATVLDGAGVEQVKEDALALLDADGFACAERLVVDRIGVGVDFETIGV